MTAFRTVRIEPTFDAWREAARALLGDGVPPEAVAWRELADAQLDALDADIDLLAESRDEATTCAPRVMLGDGPSTRLKAGGDPATGARVRDERNVGTPARVPRRFLEAAATAACHSDARR